MSLAGSLDAHFPNSRTKRLAVVRDHGVIIGTLFVAAFAFAMDANFRVVEAEDQQQFDWQIMMRLGLCGVCGLYGLWNLPYTQRELFRFPGAWLTLFGAWAAVTVPFAENVEYAAVACMALWCVILFAPALLVNVPREAITWASFFALLLFVVLCWFVFFAIPSLGRDPYLEGAMGGRIRLGGLHQPNGTGRQAALFAGLLFATPLFTRRKVLFVMLLALAAITILATGSRTSLVALVAISGMFVIRKFSFSTFVILTSISLIVVCLVISAWAAGAFRVDGTAVAEGISRDGDAEEATSLAGRTPLWEFALIKTAKSPVFGCGYECSRFVITRDHFWPTFHAHNLLLDVMMCTGLIGGGLLIAMILSTIVSALGRPAGLPDYLLMLVFVLGISDLVMLTPIANSYTLLWAVAMFWRQIPDAAGEYEHEGDKEVAHA